MDIIPVIDYLQGNVVLAVAGQRDEYKAIEDGIFAQATLPCAIDTLIKMARFKRIYIADLDSIEHQQLDATLWSDLVKAYPQIEFWLDIGGKVTAWPKFMHENKNARPIVGSESFEDMDTLYKSLESLKPYRPLLSIDLLGTDNLGPSDLLTSSSYWPEDIICLQLQRVGTSAGPDLKWLSQHNELLGKFNVYLGGGTRGIQDIQALQEQSIKGVLIAKALHSQSITQEDLKHLL